MNIEKIVKDIIQYQLLNMADEPKLNDSLRDNLGFDSLDLVEFSIALDEEFGMFITDEKLGQFETVQDVIDYVKKERKA